MQWQSFANAYVALEAPDTATEHIYTMTPEELVRMAQKLNCTSIVFNVNEPTVSIPALLKLRMHGRHPSL